MDQEHGFELAKGIDRSLLFFFFAMSRDTQELRADEYLPKAEEYLSEVKFLPLEFRPRNFERIEQGVWKESTIVCVTNGN